MIEYERPAATTIARAEKAQQTHQHVPARVPAHEQAVELCGLTRDFGAFRAVEDVSLSIRRGETVALLGPNGAGKSTTLSMLLGLLKPTRGTVAVFGMAPRAAVRHSRMGAMLQDGKLMAGVRVDEFIDFVRGQHPHPLPKDHLLDLAGIRSLTRRRVDRLSGGQTQKVRLAMAIAGDPDFLVLDEPTAAMDVEARREFWASMRAYAAQGHTILFATHYLEEAETFASRLVVIAAGHIIADGTAQDLQRQYGEARVAFTCAQAEDAAPLFARMPGVRHVRTDGQRVTLHTGDPDATVRALVPGPLPWKDLDVKRIDLEETFVTLVHRGQTTTTGAER